MIGPHWRKLRASDPMRRSVAYLTATLVTSSASSAAGGIAPASVIAARLTLTAVRTGKITNQSRPSTASGLASHQTS